MKNILPKIKLGNTGYNVSRLGLGGFHQVEVSSEIVEQVVSTYLEVGGNYIETARSYGDGASERKLGPVLKDRRKDVVLVSKSERRKGDEIRRQLEDSLAALDTDYLDIYFFHCVNTMEDMDTITGKGGALFTLLKAKEEGLIKGLGFSSHNPPAMYPEAIKRLPLSVILVWDNYLEEQYIPEIQQQIYPMARKKGIGITAMKPLGDGFLYRSVESAIRYALGSGSEMLISGTNSPEQVRQAAAAICKGPLNAEERQTVLQKAPELGRYVCRQCDGCSGKLKHLFRLEGWLDRQMIDYLPHDPADYALRLRLAGWFGQGESARRRFADKNWDEAALAGEAENVHCPYNIDVLRKTRLVLAKFNEKGADFF